MTLKVGMQHWVLEYYQVCSNDDLGLTITYFTTRSNLVLYAFEWKKGKTVDFSDSIVVCDIKFGRCSQLKVKVIHWPSSKVTQSQHFQTSFPYKPLGQFKPNFMWSLHGRREWKWVQMVYVTWPGWRPCQYMIKTFKIFIGTKRPMTLKLGTWHWLLDYYQICSNDDPGLILTYFTARSHLVPFVLFFYGKLLKLEISKKLLKTVRWKLMHIVK